MTGARYRDGLSSASPMEPQASPPKASIPNAMVGCIVCKNDLPSFDDTTNHPTMGTEFVTYGHYGSAVTDYMDGTRTAVNICDACLRANPGFVLVYEPNCPKPRAWAGESAPEGDAR